MLYLLPKVAFSHNGKETAAVWSRKPNLGDRLLKQVLFGLMDSTCSLDREY